MTRAPVLRRTPLLLAAVMAVLLSVLPAPPAGAGHTLATPTGVVVTAGDGEVSVSWGAVTNADGYSVEYREQFSAATPTVETVGNVTSATVTGLTNGQFYVFRVQATDSGGTHTSSAPSAWVTVMPEALPVKAGSLDATFGVGGVVTIDIGSSTMDEAAGTAAQVVSGGRYVAGSSGGDFAVVTITSAGALDGFFSADGKVTTDVGSSSRDEAAGLVVFSEDSLAVAGTSAAPDAGNPGSFLDGDFAVVKYTSIGGLDSTFGTGGKVVTDIGSSGDDKANAVVLQGDKIVVVGTTKEPDGSGGFMDGDFVVARYKADGTLDTDGTSGFGPASGGSRPGYVITDIGSGSEDAAHAVAIDGSGNIVVAGFSGDDFAVVRYTSAGALDENATTGFGPVSGSKRTGKVTTSVTGANAYGIANAVAMDGDKIVIAGLASDADGADYDFAVLRYTSAGALDATFSTDGIDTIGFAADGHTGEQNDAKAVAVAPDGKITVAGFSLIAGSYLAMARYNPDGTLDTSFDTDGKATFQHNNSSTTGTAVALQPDGRIIAAGGNNNDFALTSLLGQAEAPTLVRNLATLGARSFEVGATARAQAFTTGSDSAGYVLSGIDVSLTGPLVASSSANVRAELWSSNAAGNPDTQLETLTVPTASPKGRRTLAAPAGTVLAPDTTYHVVFYTVSGSWSLGSVHTDDEDPGAAAGWTIADQTSWINTANPHNPGQNTWATSSLSESYAIAVKGAARPEGSGRPIWSATLNAADIAGNFGCFGFSDSGGISCGNAAVLSNHDFAYRGSELLVSNIEHTNSATPSSRQLIFEIRTAIGDAAFKDLTLHVGNNSLAVADATVTHETTLSRAQNNSKAVWSSTGMEWSASDVIRVVLTEPETNNDLSALSASTATSAAGMFSAASLSPVFDAGTTSYGVTVGNEVTHAKLTASVEDTGKATMVVGKTGSLSALGDGATSGAIPLAVGDNALIVRVTDEGGRAQDYVVTVRRQSANNDLSSLSVSTHTSATGSFTAQTLKPSFAAGTVSYSVSVGSTVSYAKVTATPAHGGDEGATLKIGKRGSTLTATDAGDASAALPLVVGRNVLVVEVTAENGLTKNYLVTITRREPSADLSALSVRVATSETGTYSARTLRPAFDAGTVSYSVSAARDVTHAKITATALEAGATLQVGKAGSLASATSGAESAAIPVSLGANAIQVRVSATVAGTTRTKTYTVSVNVAAKPSAPTGLAVTAAPHGLDVSWTPPVVLGVHDHDVAYGYDVAYTSASAADAADDADAGGNRNPASGWVDVGHSHRDPKAGIGGLTPGVSYRVRVRGYNSFGTGPWAVASGTPVQARRTVVLSASPVRVREGDPVTVTATVMHGGRPTAVQEDLDVLLSTHLGTAEASDVGTAQRVTIGRYTASGSVTIPTFRDSDGDDETFAVLIRWIPKQDLARPGDPRIVWVTVTEGDAAPPEPVVFVPQLRASGGDGSLHLSWDRTAATQIAGYEVHYKRSDAPDAPASGGDAATGWADAGHTGTDPSLTITELVNWVDYDARVRLVFADGAGRWSEVVTAHPAAAVDLGVPTAVSVTVSHTAAAEGDTVTVTATLDDPAPRQGATVRLWAYGDTIGGTVAKAQAGGDYEWDPPDPGTPATRSVNVCDAVECRRVQRTVTATDDNASAPIRIAPGATTATAQLVMRRNATGSEPDEGIAVHATVDVADPGHQHGRRHLRSGKVTLTACEASCTAERTVGGQQSSPPEQQTAPQQPASVTLTLDSARIGESAGTATVTATLGQPAPEGGVGGFLTVDATSTATENADFSMPISVFIAGGQTSATATVTVIDDDIDEPDETVVISALFDLGTAVLEHTVTLTIADDDTAAVTVTAASPLSVSEGATGAYTVVLGSQPAADVTVTATSSDTGAVSVTPASHTFTAATWNTAKTFTVTAKADSDTDDESATVSHRVTSSDPNYAAALAAGITVSVADTTPPPQQNQQQNPPPQQNQDPPPNRAPQTTLTGTAANYDTNGDSAIDGTEYQQVKNDWLTGKITQAQFLEVVRIHLRSR